MMISRAIIGNVMEIVKPKIVMMLKDAMDKIAYSKR
jgi:hypothetical protein